MILGRRLVQRVGWHHPGVPLQLKVLFEGSGRAGCWEETWSSGRILPLSFAWHLIVVICCLYVFYKLVFAMLIAAALRGIGLGFALGDFLFLN